jgi:hypothetical protein
LWILYLYKLYMILWKIHTSKKFGPFSAIFRQICRIFGRGFSRPLIFLWGHFCVLRSKFRPVGNTEQLLENYRRTTLNNKRMLLTHKPCTAIHASRHIWPPMSTIYLVWESIERAWPQASKNIAHFWR